MFRKGNAGAPIVGGRDAVDETVDRLNQQNQSFISIARVQGHFNMRTEDTYAWQRCQDNLSNIGDYVCRCRGKCTCGKG